MGGTPDLNYEAVCKENICRGDITNSPANSMIEFNMVNTEKDEAGDSFVCIRKKMQKMQI